MYCESEEQITEDNGARICVLLNRRHTLNVCAIRVRA